MNEDRITQERAEQTASVNELASRYKELVSQESFREVYRKTHPYVYTIVADRLTRLGISPDEGQVQEAVQDVYEIIIRKIHQYDTSRDFLPWLSKIAQNAAFHYANKYKRLQQHDTVWAYGTKLADEATPSAASLANQVHLRNTDYETPEQTLMNKEELERIQQRRKAAIAILRRITNEERQVDAFLMHLEGSLNKTIAEKLGYKNADAVSQLIRRLKQKIQELRRHRS